MEDLIKISINNRKDAFLKAYKIEDSNLLKKIDDLFERIENFSKECKDYNDFEAKFSTSDLNKEYIDLFTLISKKCEPIVYKEEKREVKSDKERIKDEIKSDTKYVINNATMPVRRKVREEVERKARNTPILGDILTAKQHIDLFNKFKKQ